MQMNRRGWIDLGVELRIDGIDLPLQRRAYALGRSQRKDGLEALLGEIELAIAESHDSAIEKSLARVGIELQCALEQLRGSTVGIGVILHQQRLGHPGQRGRVPPAREAIGALVAAQRKRIVAERA